MLLLFILNLKPVDAGSGHSTLMTNDGIGKVGLIKNDGVGETGAI